jgi:hypothetical protein
MKHINIYFSIWFYKCIMKFLDKRHLLLLNIDFIDCESIESILWSWLENLSNEFYLLQEFKQILKSLHVQIALHLLLNHPPFCLMNLKLTIEVLSRNGLSWLKGWHIIMLHKDKTFTMFLLILCIFLSIYSKSFMLGYWTLEKMSNNEISLIFQFLTAWGGCDPLLAQFPCCCF